MATSEPQATESVNDQNLYHVLVTLIDYHKDKTGALQTTKICGTYRDLSKAKAAARSQLAHDGYETEFFVEYAENKGQDDWPYPDAVVVRAVAMEGEVFEVVIETTQAESHSVDAGATDPIHGLFYVVQKIVDYNTDRSGGVQTRSLEGAYKTRDEAEAAAKRVLLDEANGITKATFVEYDEAEGREDWDFGENVVVHAVAQNGEVSYVSVTPQNVWV